MTKKKDPVPTDVAVHVEVLDQAGNIMHTRATLIPFDVACPMRAGGSHARTVMSQLFALQLDEVCALATPHVHIDFKGAGVDEEAPERR